MDDFTMQDIKNLWNNLEDKTWTGLKNFIQNARYDMGEMKASLKNKLEKLTNRDNNMRDFPNSPEELSRILDED